MLACFQAQILQGPRKPRPCAPAGCTGPSPLAADENKVPTRVQRFSDLSFHLTEAFIGNLSPARRGRRMNQLEAGGLRAVVKARLHRAVPAPESA